MQFLDTTGKTGLINDCETLLGMADAEISGDTTLLKVFTRLINVWYRRTNSWIWEATGTWEFDDSNATDLPIATTDLVTTAGSEQQDYEMPSTVQKIDRVEVLNADGNYSTLKPIDKSEVGTSMSEFYETPGMPVYYDLVGRSVFLYPKPGANYVTETDGLKMYFTRDIVEFTSTDTTDEPGFVNNFHRLLSIGASIDYATSYGMEDRVSVFQKQLDELKGELKRFYGSRNRNRKLKINAPRRKYK